MQGCQPVQKAWPWASGSVGKQERIQKGIRVPPGCGSSISFTTGKLPWWEMEGERWELSYPPSLTQETVPPSQIYFTLSPPPLPPPLSPTLPSTRIFFSCLFLSALWFCSCSSYPPLMPLSRSQQGLTWLWDPKSHTYASLSQSIEIPHVIKHSGLDCFMAHTTCEEGRANERNRFHTGFNRTELAWVREPRLGYVHPDHSLIGTPSKIYSVKYINPAKSPPLTEVLIIISF